MGRLSELIKVYPNALNKTTCKSLIKFFDDNVEKQEKCSNDGKPNFVQVNLTKHKDLSEKLHDTVLKKVLQYKKKYYDFIDSRVFPNENSFEQFRIKRYNTGGEDRFDTHVDVADHSSARRYLSFMFYLNNVSEGGETVFNDIQITPEQGTLVVFPPLWMYPHRGNPPISNSKYIMSTYLHYT